MIRLEFGVVLTAVLRLRCLNVDIVYVEMLYSTPSSTFLFLCQSCALYPVNTQDPIRKRFGYGHLWPLLTACGQNWPGSYIPDPNSRIRLDSVFPKTAWIKLCKTDPDPMWTVWSWFGQTHLVWRQAGVQESSGPVSGRTQPVSHFQTRFRYSTDVPDNTVQNQPGSDSVLADCVRFWPNRSGPEASQCARIVRPVSGQCFPADPDRMRMGSGMFTGQLFHYQYLLLLLFLSWSKQHRKSRCATSW